MHMYMYGLTHYLYLVIPTVYVNTCVKIYWVTWPLAYNMESRMHATAL